MTAMHETGWPEHGGRVAPLLARFGLPPDHSLVDFSANLNPLGPPAWLGGWLADAAMALGRYPDPDDDRASRAIGAHEGISPEWVLPTNGGAEAIFLAAALHAGGRAVIVQPTFTEYARACHHYGLAAADLALRGDAFRLDIAEAERAMAGAGVLFLCRPNNPTATLVPRRDIERLLARGRETGTTLVVDEAFIDFTDGDARLTPLLAESPNLLLLRSLTKRYDVPGLRLGYLLGAPETLRRARALQLPWSVNGLALGLVAPLLADDDYWARTRAWLAGERPRMLEAVRALGYRVPASQANFYLLRAGRDAAEGEALFAFLLRRGLLARHTRNFPGLDGAWLRLALRDGADNDRLLEALADWRGA